MTSSDIIRLYEVNIKKTYDILDSYIYKSNLYEDEYLSQLISQIENLLLSLEKDIKNYTLELSLHLPSSSIIKQANSQLNQYKSILFFLKEKQIIKNIYVISSPYDYKKEEEKVNKDSFLILQQGIRDVNDIENTSGKVLNSLNEKSEQMKNVNMKVNFLNEDLNESNNVLVKMLGRKDFDKKLIVFVGFILLVILIIILTIKIIMRYKYF